MLDFLKNRRNQYILSILLFLVLIISGVAYFNQASKAARGVTGSVDPTYSAYVSSYTAGVISSRSNIIIRLSQDYADSSEVDSPIDFRLFRFNPGISGKAHWIDARTIEFRPDDRLNSGQTYKVHFLLSKLVKVPAKFETFSFSFQTIRQDYEIQIDGLKAYNDQDLKKQKLLGTLITADLANEEKIEKILTANQGDQNLKFQWNHETENNKHHFEIGNIIREEASSKVVVLANGKSIGVDKKETIEFDVPAIGSFEVMEVKVIQSPEQYVSLRFSDPLSEKQDFTGLVEIGELQDLRYQVSSNELMVFPIVRQAGQKEVRINKGVENILGYKLEISTTRDVVFEQIKPAIRVAGKGVILPQTDGMVFPFESVNLRAVDLKIIKIYEDNIAQFLQRNNFSGNAELVRVGYPVLKKTISLSSQGITDFGSWNRFTFDLSTLIESEPGAIYQLQVGFRKEYSTYYCEGQSTEDINLNLVETEEIDFDSESEFSSWDSYEEYYYYPGYEWRERDNPCHSSYYGSRRTIYQNILASDIGIMAKKGENSALMVVVTDLISAKPLSGVNIEILDFQQQVISTGLTNQDGLLELDLRRRPFLIIAHHNGQRGYLKLPDGLSLSLSNFDVSGQKVQKGIKGYIYGERGVWRPGDSLHIAFILEDRDQVLPKNHPVIFELLNPRSQVDQRMVRSASVNGIYNFSTKTSSEAMTGNWNTRIRVGGATFYKKIKIETVKPNRLKINLDFGEDKLTAGQKSMSGNLEVKWLHGAIARNMHAVFDVLLTPIKTSFDAYPNYSFDDPSKEYYPEKKQIFDGYTDDNGKAVMNVDFGSVDNSPGILRAYFSGKVFEPSGNFSIDRFSIPFYPYDHFVGVRLPEGDRRGMLLTDTTHYIDVVTVNAEGMPVSRQNIEIEVYKLDWRWWWDNSSNGVSNYLGRTHQQPVKKAKVNTVNGKARGKFKIEYPDWGRFFVRVYDPASGHSAGKIVYVDWPGWAGRGKRAFPGSATMLSFSTDKEVYKVGERVELTLPGAENGRAFITVENGARVLQKWWINTQPGEVGFSFKVTPEMTPNVFVFISLLQPHGNTANDLPIRMYGVVPIKVENPQTILKPEIEMPDVLVPEERVRLKVSESNGKPMSYTVAVVDDGLLDLTKFKTPDPHSVFYSREALGVKTWDLFDDVIGAYGGKLERILAVGGDEEGSGAENKRANRFKPVVKFLGPFHLARNQTAEHSFIMPEYIGSVRTMIIAAYEGSYGSVDKTTPVRKPLMVLGTLPRVLGPSERVKLPVTVFAMEEGINNVAVTIEANEMFEITGPRRQALSFSSIGDQLVEFDLSTIPMTGIGKVDIVAKAGNKMARHSIEIEIRNPNPPITDVFDAMLQAGETWQQQFKALGIPGTNTASVEISSIPPINLEQRLKYLLNYPHGCIEQVTSSVFPQLYITDFVDLPMKVRQDIEWNVKSGIKKLQSFQLSNGGFAYWPGREDPNSWGTSYAGHFMLEAKKKGYEVPESILQKWQQYQLKMANQWKQNSNYERGDITQAYRLYTLALADKPARGAMNRMMEEQGLSIAARWKLASAFTLAGNQTVAKTITRNLGYDVSDYRELGGNFGSRTRDMAMILEALALMDEKTKGVDLLKRISAELSNKANWMSTQETAFALIAIGQFVTLEERVEGIDCGLKVNGGKDVGFKSNLPMIRKEIIISDKENEIVVANNSQGVAFIRLTTSGKPISGDEQDVFNELKLTLHYRDTEGKIIDPSKMGQGQNFQVEIGVLNPGLRGNYQQLALTQIFPSGWEILNARMDESIALQEQSRSEYQDIRDDRVFTYFDLAPNQRKTFVISLIATYSGTFYLPSTTCDAMYDKSINARIHGMQVNVQSDRIQ